MAYVPVSAFQRPLSYAQVEQVHRAPSSPPPVRGVNKWALLRSLVAAKDRFGVTAQDLALLQGLLSFYPHDTLEQGEGLILFPSNRSICERMQGLPDSTMRRHLRNLLAAGLLLRRDSHNGKRFTTCHNGERIAYGLDLTPLLLAAASIQAAAEEVEAAKAEAKRLRLDVQLMRRDIFAMMPLLPADLAAEAQNHWEAGSRILRRKLNAEALSALHSAHLALLDRLKTVILNSSDVHNEQHIHKSNKEYLDSERAEKDQRDEASLGSLHSEDVGALNSQPVSETGKADQDLSLATVMLACPEISNFCDRPIDSWPRLVEASYGIYRAIGITEASHSEAVSVMGQERTAVLIAALLQKFDKIRSPGAYLRTLVAKAAQGAFSCRSMIHSMLRSPGRLNSC